MSDCVFLCVVMLFYVMLCFIVFVQDVLEGCEATAAPEVIDALQREAQLVSLQCLYVAV